MPRSVPCDTPPPGRFLGLTLCLGREGWNAGEKTQLTERAHGQERNPC